MITYMQLYSTEQNKIYTVAKWFLRCGLMKRHDRSRFKSERTELIILK